MNNRGVALIIALIVMSMVIGLSSVYVLTAVTEKKMSDFEVNVGKAVYAAEAGASSGVTTLDKLINQYMYNAMVDAKNTELVSTKVVDCSSSPLGSTCSTRGPVQLLLDYVLNDQSQAVLSASGSGTSTKAVYSTEVSLDAKTKYQYSIYIWQKSAATTTQTGVYDFPFYYRIESKGISGGQQRKMTLNGDFTVEVSRDNFSRYALFTTTQKMSTGTDVWFANSTYYYGPLYTSGRYNFWGTPTFVGTVKQVETTAKFYSSSTPLDANSYKTDVPKFSSSFLRGVSPISMPGTDQQTAMANEATNNNTYTDDGSGIVLPADAGNNLTGGIYVTGDASIGLSTTATGQTIQIVKGTTTKTISINKTTGQTTVVKKVGTATTTTIYTGVPSGKSGVGTIVYVNGVGTISGGTVHQDNQMTIAAKSTLNITDSIVYQKFTPASGTIGNANYQPISAEGYNNLLGLMSWEGNVVIKGVTETALPTQNIQVHGIVMAPLGQFMVYKHDSIGVRGTATLLGGVITKYYGPFGTGNPSTSGYNRSFIYDKRMSGMLCPPYFPPAPNVKPNGKGIGDNLVWQQGGFTW